jgi:hypothetical protein
LLAGEERIETQVKRKLERGRGDYVIRDVFAV